MTGENDLHRLLKTMKPKQNRGDYVFCTVETRLISKTQAMSEESSREMPIISETHGRASLQPGINLKDVILMFKEEKGTTIVLKKEIADSLKREYSFVLNNLSR